MSYFGPRPNFPVGGVPALSEEAWLGGRRGQLRTLGTNRGGLSVEMLSSVRGGHQGAGDNTLLIANTTAGRALRSKQKHTHSDKVTGWPFQVKLCGNFTNN